MLITMLPQICETNNYSYNYVRAVSLKKKIKKVN